MNTVSQVRKMSGVVRRVLMGCWLTRFWLSQCRVMHSARHPASTYPERPSVPSSHPQLSKVNLLQVWSSRVQGKDNECNGSVVQWCGVFAPPLALAP